MNKLPLIIGITGSFLLGSLYFLFLLLIGGVDHALGFIQSLWYWLIIIILGFGAQVGLYTYIRQKIRSRAATAEVSTSLGISTGSMIACCLHLAVDLLPIIGLSALTIFLLDFQTPILLIGVFSNIIGIVFMISSIKNHSLYNKNSFFGKLPKLNFKLIIISLVIIGSMTVTSTALFADENEFANNLTENIQKVNRVTFKVKPEIIPNESINIFISMDTHSVNLNFNMVEIASLSSADGKLIYPNSWTGSSEGGHHREGYLTFRYYTDNLKELELLVTPPGRKFKEMRFQWELK